MLALLLPLPETNDRPVVRASVSRPLVAESTTCIGRLPASMSFTTGAAAPDSTSGVSSATVAVAASDSVGASLTAATSTMKVVRVVLPPSNTDSMTVAGPPLALLLALGAGVRLIVRPASLPPSTKLAFGSSAWLLEVTVTVRPSTAVSASPMVNESGPAVPPSSTSDWLATALIVGA